MARYRKGGFIFECWISDHPPKHFHIFNNKGKFIGRFDIESMKPIGNWLVSKKMIKLIQEVIKEENLL